MLRERNHSEDLSEFLRYLAEHDQAETQGLPSLAEMSQELGISVAALREQLEVARALGLVEVRPRTGMRRLPYTFLPAVRQSLGYAITCDNEYFNKYAELRKYIETAFWYDAVRALTDQDKEDLQVLINRAWVKLRGTPVQIPHEEHRKLHMLIYSRLDNPFVTGLLDAYWEAYEAVGLNLFTGYEYLQEVWQYHTNMVNAIRKGDYEAGYHALLEHTDLIYHRPPTHP
jgi:DNA-binding FadR family transcriptional regulator